MGIRVSGARHKRKGSRVEREIVKLLEGAQLRARRQPLSGALQDFPHDVSADTRLGTLIFEVKARREGSGFQTLDRWKGKADVLVLKRNNAEPMAYLSLKLLADALADPASPPPPVPQPPVSA